MKPKHLCGLLLAMLFAQNVAAQNVHYVQLKEFQIERFDCHFYVDSIIDRRPDKEFIGEVRKGFFNTPRKAKFQNGFINTLFRYFNRALPRAPDKKAVTIVIKKFVISEKATTLTEYAYMDLDIVFYYGNEFVYSTHQHTESQRTDVTRQHPGNILNALNKAILDFEEAARENNLATSDKPIDETETETADSTATAVEPGKNTSRDVFAVGYQIGGYCLIGVDLEFRIHDYVGVHLGGGIRGYTAGIKLHTGASKNSPFFNFNYKDGGFGLIRTAGIDFGVRLTLRPEGDFAIHGQIGLAGIIEVDPGIADVLFTEEIPDYILAIGIGFSWTM